MEKLNIKDNFALLLTATIDIKGMPNAYPSIIEKRQEDYFNSLRYYVEHHPQIRKIIFVENSNSPLDRVKEAVAHNPYQKEIEFISLNCNDFPRKFGKGYGECLLVEKGLQQSELINRVTHFAKITGRIYLKNITQLLEALPDCDCLCDYKDMGYILKRIGGEKSASPYCDTRFIVFRKELYQKYIQPLHQKYLEKSGSTSCFYIETEFYHAIRQAEKKAKIISRFSIEPDFQGVAGHFKGKNYSSPLERTKFTIRSFLRKVTPLIHI